MKERQRPYNFDFLFSFSFFLSLSFSFRFFLVPPYSSQSIFPDLLILIHSVITTHLIPSQLITPEEMVLVRDDVSGGSTKSSKDVLIENFDISYGGNVLMEGCFIRLVYGRKYALVREERETGEREEKEGGREKREIES